MELIQSVTLGTAASTIDFDDIPQDFQDLQILYSTRQTTTGYGIFDTIAINGNKNNQTIRRLRGNGSNAASTTNSFIVLNGNSSTANTHDNGFIYISNYAQSGVAKALSSDSVSESNGGADQAFTFLTAMLWNDTSPITSISFTSTNNFVANSSVYLYGVRSARSQAWATGGEISYDAVNDKFYHVFTSSGTFTPLAPIDVEYLVIAGGGGGGSDDGGGGGAGGYRSSVVGESSGGGASAESKLSLASGTGYTVTVGAGGTGSTSTSSTGNKGSDSAFGAITSTGGGGGKSRNSGVGNSAGGSGGGGSYNNTTPGIGTANQGYNGGTGSTSVNSGGGGGAGGVGGNAGGTGGSGGVGVSSSVTGSSVGRAGGGGGGNSGTATDGGGTG